MQNFSVRERLGVAAAGAIVLLIGVGGWSYSHAGVPGPHRPAGGTLAPVGPNGGPVALELPAAGSAAGAESLPHIIASASPAASSAAAILVHVAGAVRNPGVYKFKDGDRINDAVHAAGGFQSSADRDALNLADTLRDADQIYIPTAEDKAPDTRAARGVDTAFAAGGGPPYPGKTRSRRSSRSHPLLTPGTARTGEATAVAVLPVTETVSVPGITAQVPVGPRPRGRIIGRTAPAIITSSTVGIPDGDATDANTGDPSGTDVSALSAAGSTRGTGSPGKRGRAMGGSVAKGGSTKSSGKFKNPGDGVVHLNSATAAQLEHLPGVGPAMSGRIVEYRTQIGKFNDISQIQDVKGIGEKKYAKMQPFLAL